MKAIARGCEVQLRALPADASHRPRPCVRLRPAELEPGTVVDVAEMDERVPRWRRAHLGFVLVIASPPHWMARAAGSENCRRARPTASACWSTARTAVSRARAWSASRCPPRARGRTLAILRRISCFPPNLGRWGWRELRVGCEEGGLPCDRRCERDFRAAPVVLGGSVDLALRS